MKNKIILVGLALWFTCIHAQPKVNKKLLMRFDKVMSDHFKSTEPGGAVLVAQNGKVIYEKALGMANLELNIPLKTGHVFRIGSLTKQFTAVAILQLMEQGKLSLQDEIIRFIPDYPAH